MVTTLNNQAHEAIKDITKEEIKGYKSWRTKEVKINDIKYIIRGNEKELERLKFGRTMTTYKLGGGSDIQDCDPCKLGKQLVNNEEIDPRQINFCPRHKNIYDTVKGNLIKENKRLGKRLLKLEANF
ncbi:MAG: hypothetical protein I3273_04170 [Candidatus Moeniiplasma glomeromycotorum]|nr:hypothetical protein [Candidatus Moeniiplasma glomeromycotorum]